MDRQTAIATLSDLINDTVDKDGHHLRKYDEALAVLIADQTVYTLCVFCDHFVEPNDAYPDRHVLVAEYVHLADCEDDNEASDPDGYHNAVPSALSGTLDYWRMERPDLFIDHGDGHIGPNSEHHVMGPR